MRGQMTSERTQEVGKFSEAAKPNVRQQRQCVAELEDAHDQRQGVLMSGLPWSSARRKTEVSC